MRIRLPLIAGKGEGGRESPRKRRAIVSAGSQEHSTSHATPVGAAHVTGALVWNTHSMYACMYVRVCVCPCVCLHVSVYVCTYIYIHVYM